MTNFTDKDKTEVFSHKDNDSMSTQVFAPKVDYWVYGVGIFTVVICMIGPVLDDDILFGIVFASIMLALLIFCFTGVKYEIRGQQLGIRNLYRWMWIPICHISEVKKTRSILATAAMSFDRLSITLSNRSVVKSFMPIEIAPKHPDKFIAALKRINPDIKVG